MRVVFLTHNYPRYHGDVAGAFLHPLAIALREAGEPVDVVAPADRGQGGTSALDGVPVHRVRYGSPSRERYAYTGSMQEAVRSPAGLLALRRLHRSLRTATAHLASRDTVVHAHWWIPAGLAAPPEQPLVVTLHGTDAMLLARSALARRLARPVLHRARVVTTVSTALAQVVAEHARIPLDRIRVQPMPVDTMGWHWTTGGGGVLVVARLVAQKRVHLALEALEGMRRHGVQVPCTIVGEGPERPRLEGLVQRLGLQDAVTFTGALPFPQVQALLQSADLAIAPSRGEGFGLAAAEAMMSGVPVVACHDGGGLLDIVPVEGAGRIAAPDGGSVAVAATALLHDAGAKEAARTTGATWREALAPAQVASRFRTWYAEARGG